MMTKKIVIALGGNAILTDDPSAQGQQKALEYTSERLADLIEQGYQLAVSHGNGPQVGNLLLQQLAAESDKNPVFPLDTLVSMTQGSIGYWLANALQKSLAERQIEKQIAPVLTQVVVDKDDQAFENPTKPIGPFYSEEEAKQAMEESNETYVEDAGRGWRKVVASPKPVDIVEYPVVKSLIDQDVLTISAGGGGIPVVKDGNSYSGVEAVIDKDFASAKLAELIEADYLLILTGVDNVYINFNQDNEEKLEDVTVDQMKQWIAEDQFAPGSMLPKVEAAIEFVEKGNGAKAIITSLENVKNYFDGGSATVISK